MTNSQFFRDALANKELEPIAASIKEKASHHQKDSTFVYPLWQLQNDISALKAKAKQFGTSENYPDDLIQHMKESPQTDGFLICYYQSYSGFMLQWLLIGSIVLMAVYFSTSKKIGPKSNVGKISKGIGLQAVIIVVNGWAFASRPAYLPFIYWLLPGFVFCFCIVIAILRSRK